MQSRALGRPRNSGPAKLIGLKEVTIEHMATNDLHQVCAVLGGEMLVRSAHVHAEIPLAARRARGSLRCSLFSCAQPDSQRQAAYPGGLDHRYFSRGLVLLVHGSSVVDVFVGGWSVGSPPPKQT